MHIMQPICSAHSLPLITLNWMDMMIYAMGMKFRLASSDDLCGLTFGADHMGGCICVCVCVLPTIFSSATKFYSEQILEIELAMRNHIGS